MSRVLLLLALIVAWTEASSNYSSYIPTLNCSMTEFEPLPAEKCDSEAPFMKDVYFHALFDFKRISSVPLFLSQVCRALSLCFRRRNFRVAIERPSNASTIYYRSAIGFLNKNRIAYYTWKGVFDTRTAQRIRLKLLRSVNHSSAAIMQVDTDEFPKFSMDEFARMVKLVTSTVGDNPSEQCDVIYGNLAERLPYSGNFNNVTLYKPLLQQFPLICNAKAALEGAASRKVILYRALYRPTTGNHKLFCEGKGNLTDCAKSISSNSYAVKYHPTVTRKPNPCSLTLEVDHYKYTWGVIEYLKRRVVDFKKAGLSWYKESEAILKHIDAHNGRICVECPEIKCIKSV